MSVRPEPHDPPGPAVFKKTLPDLWWNDEDDDYGASDDDDYNDYGAGDDDTYDGNLYKDKDDDDDNLDEENASLETTFKLDHTAKLNMKYGNSSNKDCCPVK